MDSSNNKESIRCKTILVGNSGVGKTSIISSYLSKYNPNQKTTIGASFTNKTENINGQEVVFEIWDTAGQERFRSINSIFYQDAYICILVYDITKKESFEHLRDYWYNTVKEQGTAGMIFHVAGNKIDLFNNEEVEKKDVEEFCNRIDAGYDFISAQEHQFIDELFKKLAEKFLNSDIYKSKVNNKKNKLKIELDDNDNQEKEQKKKKKCCS